MLRIMASPLLAKRRLRVCFFTDTFLPKVGGAETVLDHLADNFARRGDSPLVLAPRPNRPVPEIEREYKIVRFTPPFSKWYGVHQLLWPLWRQHQKHQFDLIHCHSSYPQAYVARTFQAWTGIPYIVRPHGSDILPGRRVCRHKVLRERVRQSLLGAAAVIAQGQFMRDAILEFGVQPDRIHVINNGVDIQAFAPLCNEGIANPYILGIGNLIQRKGLDLLLKAYASLQPAEVELVIAGDGPERQALEKLAAELGIAGRVTFPGNVQGEQKRRVYRNASLLVIPSRSEPFANVILEGMAAGLPIVASNVGGNTELIEHEANGLLFETENVDSLAATLHRMLNDQQLQARMRSATPEIVARFDWSKVSLQYSDLYWSVLSQSKTRAA